VFNYVCPCFFKYYIITTIVTNYWHPNFLLDSLYWTPLYPFLRNPQFIVIWDHSGRNGWRSVKSSLQCVRNAGKQAASSTLPSPTDSRWSPPELHKSMWTPSGKDLNLQFCINPSGVHMDSTWNPPGIQVASRWSSPILRHHVT